MKRVLKISPVVWDNASRDKRELSVLQEMGAEVLVFAKGEPSDKGRKTTISGFDVFLYSTKPLGQAGWLGPLNKLVTVIQWSCYVRGYHADILSCHDLPALLIGWISTWFKTRRNKPVLVYDSHEFELGRATERSKITSWAIKCLEGFLIRRCGFSIMVNDSIADEVQRIYKLEMRPVVVRNIPNRWHLDQREIAAARAKLCGQLGLPANTFLVMYHGAIMPQRSIEILLQAVCRNNEIAAVILGNAMTEDYLDELKRKAEELGIKDRVLFHPAVPLDSLYKYVGAVDLSTVLIQAKYRSYYLSLPNKLFESIQCLTPLIVSNFPEMRRVVENYKIGLTVDITDTASIDSAIERMRTDHAFYNQCKQNLIPAKEELCWENEKASLKEASGC